MAGKRLRDNGTWEFTIKRAGLLEKPIYLTFDSEKEGDEHCARIEALLDQGIVPAEYQVEGRVITIADLDREYQREAHPSDKDVGALGVVVRKWGHVRLTQITARWVDDWISSMKRNEVLAPATIRARVGALARCTDWGMRKGYLTMPDHPLRSLPKGYAQYSKLDEALAGEKREDEERDRRLEDGEYERILAVIERGSIKQKQRDFVIPDKLAVRCMFILAVESAMRMREIYTLTREQVDLRRLTIFLDKTKNGDKRQVPITTVALGELKAYFEAKGEALVVPDTPIFPWWDGSLELEKLKETTKYVSKMYAKIFAAAGCEDLGFHDLRHEATSRIFERSSLSDTEVMKITGHKSVRMLMRYANLRASTLAARLW